VVVKDLGLMRYQQNWQDEFEATMNQSNDDFFAAPRRKREKTSKVA